MSVEHSDYAPVGLTYVLSAGRYAGGGEPVDLVDAEADDRIPPVELPTRRRTSARPPVGSDFERRTVTTTSSPSLKSTSAQQSAATLPKGRAAGADAGGDLDRIDTGTRVGLRHRALLSVMVYSFARVSAAVGMRRQDYFRQGVRGWLRLHEKGGKRHDVPAHHRAEEAVETYVAAGGLEDARAPLFQSVDRSGRLSGRPLGRRAVLAMIKRRAMAAGLPATTVLPHVSGDGDHGVPCRTGGRSSMRSGSRGTRRRRRQSSTTGRRTRSRSTRSSAS